MKVAELTGPLLNFWVAKANGDYPHVEPRFYDNYSYPEYSTDWSQGGPIIDGMKPTGFYYWKPTDEWTCAYGNGPRWRTGNTALIAAMRCYVASKFGQEVPDE